MLPPNFQQWFDLNLRPVSPLLSVEELGALATVNTPFSLAKGSELESIRKFCVSALKRAKHEEAIAHEREREARILDGALSLLLEEGLDITGTNLVEAKHRFLARKSARTARVVSPPKVEVFETVRPLLGQLEITSEDLQSLGIDSMSKPLRDHMYHHGYKSVHLRGRHFFRKKEVSEDNTKRKRERILTEDVIEWRRRFIWENADPKDLAREYGRDDRLVDYICRNKHSHMNEPFPRQDGTLVVLPKVARQGAWDRAQIRRFLSTK